MTEIRKMGYVVQGGNKLKPGTQERKDYDRVMEILDGVEKRGLKGLNQQDRKWMKFMFNWLRRLMEETRWFHVADKGGLFPGLYVGYETEEEAYEAYKKYNLDNFNIEII